MRGRPKGFDSGHRALIAMSHRTGNSWNKIRYIGGTVAAKVNPYDWNTTLSLTSDSINLVFLGRTSFRLAPSQVTAPSYGEKAYRRVADMVNLERRLCKSVGAVRRSP